VEIPVRRKRGRKSSAGFFGWPVKKV
jgi:hypothetical protein